MFWVLNKEFRNRIDTGKKETKKPTNDLIENVYFFRPIYKWQ